jgi:hypothetical protein
MTAVCDSIEPNLGKKQFERTYRSFSAAPRNEEHVEAGYPQVHVQQALFDSVLHSRPAA